MKYYINLGALCRKYLNENSIDRMKMEADDKIQTS